MAARVALYCEQGGIVNWLEVYFCAVREGSPQAVAAKTAVFWVGLALLLIMLFLALGSTAEDYFAPVSYTHLTLPTKRIV